MGRDWKNLVSLNKFVNALIALLIIIFGLFILYLVTSRVTFNTDELRELHQRVKALEKEK